MALGEPRRSFYLDAEEYWVGFRVGGGWFGAAGIAYADGFVYVVNGYLGKVYSYDDTGGRAEQRDFVLELPSGYTAVGITFGGGFFYVVADSPNDLSTYPKVFAYDGDGNRAAWRDFSVEASWEPRGVAYADGVVYVMNPGEFDWSSRPATSTLVAYDGGRRAAESDLIGFSAYYDYRGATGVGYADGLFYLVVAGFSHANDLSGRSGRDQRELNHRGEHGFPLSFESRNSGGIAYGDGRFYVVDLYANAVFVYRWMGTLATSPPGGLRPGPPCAGRRAVPLRRLHGGSALLRRRLFKESGAGAGTRSARTVRRGRRWRRRGTARRGAGR